MTWMQYRNDDNERISESGPIRLDASVVGGLDEYASNM